MESYFRGRAKLDRFEKPSRLRSAERARFRKAWQAMKHVMEGGAGQIADGELRTQYLEMNHRLLERGPSVMPTQFNVFEAFLGVDQRLGIYALRPEHDHLFSWSDFIDFVTSRDCSGEARSSVYRLNSEEIYSYSVYDDPHDLTFSTDAAHEFTVGGISIIRHDDEVTVLVIGGQVADLEAETEGVRSYDVSFTGRGKRGMEVVGQQKPEALGPHEDLWKTLAYMRFNIDSSDESIRYALQDRGNHFLVATNDLSVFDDEPKAERDRLIAGSQKHLVAYSVLFDLANTACFLPEYFTFKYVLIRDEPGRPQPAWNATRTETTDDGLSEPQPASIESNRIYKRVSALRIVTTADRAPSIRRFAAPQFRVPVRGFWREIDAASTGKGPNGEVVIGRTWVHDHERWRELPARPRTVLVKSRVAIARQLVEEDRVAAPRSELEPEQPRQPKSERVSRTDQYKQRKLLSRRLRWRILQRDDFRCRKCGADAASDHHVRLDVDHIIPVSAGGRTEPGNLQTLCSACNGGKGELL
ncbi:MAG TPA: HNH endonuclease signature motif containing protein [Thermoanaerobaculia bacterium]|nr:HNH endonuclease signature motif containing protein [Thermoanaerobaculia bacterium]